MLGAIIGDMVGSQYDFNPIKTKKFNAFNPNNKMTDDSYLTIAVAKVLLKHYPIKYTQKKLEKIQKDLTNEFVLTFKNHHLSAMATCLLDGVLIQIESHITLLEMALQ